MDRLITFERITIEPPLEAIYRRLGFRKGLTKIKPDEARTLGGEHREGPLAHHPEGGRQASPHPFEGLPPDPTPRQSLPGKHPSR